MLGPDNISKGSSYDAVSYAESEAGKAIAKLRAGWEKEFPTNMAADVCDESDSDEEDDDDDDEDEEDK